MGYPTIAALQQALRAGETTVEAVVQGHLQRIEDGAHLNVFIEVWADEALQRAQVVQDKIRRGEAGKLAGVTVALKDNLCYRGHRATASSRILEGFESLFTATAVQRLLDEDAIVLGRTGSDEFAMGSSNETSVYGPVKNPLDPTRVPGGSSGGAAAAVAAGMAHIALGSDTGGSIRQPAAFCGVVGAKPTYGRISRSGLIAYASSFDQIGPFAHSIEDVALVTSLMSGQDPADATTSRRPAPEPMSQRTAPLRVAVLSEGLSHPGLDPEVAQALRAKTDALRAEGHVVEEVTFPYLDVLVPIYYVLTTAEASSNLARFDGIHMGYRSKNATDLESTYVMSRTEGFGTEVKRRILLGTFVLSSGFYDAYYTRGQKARRKVQQALDAILNQYDVLLMPTTPHTAFEIGRPQEDPTVMYLEDIFTVLANLTGNPAVSIPLGHHSNGLPMGLQLVGKRWDEAGMFEAARTMSLSVA
jgi:aspartyl-tRNA(Asn)/glutamyl-tRNA(Gln) amidotransferase subunit A